MNSVLGGQFASRINMNLREDKGYSYGMTSSFAFWQGSGPFEAGGTVQTAVTKESLVEIFKELSDLNTQRPVTDAELAFSKDRNIQGFPSRFETTFGVAGQIAILVADELPDDEFEHYQARILAVGKADVARVARSLSRRRRWRFSSWGTGRRSKGRSRPCRLSTASNGSTSTASRFPPLPRPAPKPPPGRSLAEA